MNVAATTAMRSPRSVCVGSSTGAGYARASQHGRTQVVCVLFLASSRLADRCTGSRSGISAAFITSEPELQRWPFNEVVSAGRPIWRQQPDEPYGVIEVDPRELRGPFARHQDAASVSTVQPIGALTITFAASFCADIWRARAGRTAHGVPPVPMRKPRLGVRRSVKVWLPQRS